MENYEHLLSVQNLHTAFSTDNGTVQAVNGISFNLDKGKTLGIVGESGSGKSVTAYSVMQILSENGKITEGNVLFKGDNITKWSEKQMRSFRGKSCSIIFQDPMTSLNPVFTVGNQIMEGIRLHSTQYQSSPKERALEMLKLVGINEPEKRLKQYPYELSGGMRKAFCILIDRQYICDNIGQTGQKPANSFIPIGMADGNGGVFKADENANAYYDVKAITDDTDATLEEARTLLKAAGYKFGDDGMLDSSTPISIEYLTNNGTGHVAVAEAMQQDFGAIGINMTIQSEDWNVFLEERKSGNFDFAREGWLADFNDPINMLEMWVTESGNNDCQFGKTASEAAASTSSAS